MDRIPPSQQLRQRLDDLLQHGLQGEQDVATLALRLGTELVLQAFLEAESKEYLGRDHYERRAPECQGAGVGPPTQDGNPDQGLAPGGCGL